MRIQNLKAPLETVTPMDKAGDAPASMLKAVPPSPGGSAGSEYQMLEIAFLKARVAHLELVLETARSLMGSNHERLLHRLHDTPREMAELSAQLRRINPQAGW